MLTLALGLAAVVRPFSLRGRVRTYTLEATIAGVAAAIVLADGETSRAEGGALVGLYVVVVAVVWMRERHAPVIGELAEVLDDEADHEADDEAERPAVGLMLAVAGIAVMAAGGTVAVEGAERVVAALSLTDTSVGLTLVALATTAELLALVWAAARHDVSERAVAAIVGSAAYNATATLGAATLARPASGLDLRAAAVLAAALPAVVVAAGGQRQALGRLAGVALLAGYLAFVAVALT
jgi:cation:H+ antiporter